jgi:peroxiredoxin
MKKIISVLSILVVLSSCEKETTTPANVTSGTSTPATNTPATPAAAESAPDFTLTSDADEKVNLSDYKGKVIVLFFFGNGCSSCKATSPSIQTAFGTGYDAKKFQIIGLDTWDGNLASVQAFKKSSNLTFPLLLNASPVAKTFNTTYDRLMVIDKEGFIRFKGNQLAGNDLTNAKKSVDDYVNK